MAETINLATDALNSQGWVTQEITPGKTKVFRDTASGVVEFETKRLVVSELDPWQLSVASTSDIAQNRCQPGFLENKCLPTELIEFVKLAGIADVATFQVGPAGRLTIVFSAEFGYMPTVATWRVSKKTVDATLNDEYTLLVCETQTRWKKFKKTWLPCEYNIRQFAGGKNAVSDLAIKCDWCIGPKVDKASVVSMRASELYQYLAENAVKLPTSK